MNTVTTATSEATYQTPDLAQFFRRPDSLVGQRFVLRGRVVQIWEDRGEPIIILEVEAGPYPDNEVAVTLPRWQGPWPQGELTVYGVCRGTHVELHPLRCGVVARPHLEAELVK